MSENREKMLETLFEVLNKATLLFSQSESLSDDTMSEGVGLIADMLDIDRFAIWRNSTKPSGLHATRVYRWDREAGNTTLLFPSWDDVPYTSFVTKLEKAFALGRSVFCCVSELPESSVLKSSRIKTAFLSPIFISNELWGFALFGDTNAERVFDSDSLEMMRSAAFLISNTVIRVEMEREAAEKSALNRIMFDAGPTGLVVFGDNRKIIDCNDAVVAMFDTSKKYIIEHFVDLLPKYQLDGSESLGRLSDLIQRTLSSKQGEKTALEWEFKSLAGEAIPCEMTLVCSTYQRKPAVLAYLYDLRNIKLMESNIEKLESIVDYDALTCIGNRRFFDINLKRLMKSLSRSGNMLSLLLIDIDCFKQYNDNYGHVAGDECLRKVAAILTNSITRDDDFVARYGGEEFAIVLPNTDAEGARIVAEKVLENIRKGNIPHEKSTVADHITVSIGGMTARVHHTHHRSNYIERADKMLYVSKQKGRNQASFAPLEEQT